MIAPRASNAPPAFGYSPPSVPSVATLANLEVARRYLAALEAGAVGDELAAFFSPDVEQIEFPNRLVPSGGRRGLPEMLEGARRGQHVLREQRYQVDRAFADGDAVVLEALWVGTLAIDRGSIPAGQEQNSAVHQRRVGAHDLTITRRATRSCIVRASRRRHA